MTQLERICRVVAEVIGVEPTAIHASSRQADHTEWDSVALVNLMVAIEAEFDVQLSVDDGMELTSIERISAVVDRRKPEAT